MHRQLSRGVTAVLLGTFAALGLFGSLGTAAPAGATGPLLFGSQVTANQWTSTNPPNGASPSSYDSSVSCVSSVFCVATVLQEDPSNGNAYVQVWNGSTWSNQQVPTPSGVNDAVLFSVSCTAVSSCVAVGDTSTGVGLNPTIQPFTIVWNGNGWTIGPLVSVPADDNETFLESVSCTGPAWCTTVGDATDTTTEITQPIVAVWDGATWTSTLPPVPGAASSALIGISCTSPTNCMAVGASASNATPFAIPHAASPGSEPGSLPGPFGSGLPGLAALSEGEPTGSTDPHAVSHQPPADQVLAMQWNGSTWTVSPSVAPANSTDPEFQSVSCAGSGFCMATGLSFGSTLSTFTEAFNGGAWSEVPVPAPTTGGVLYMAGVSCISSTSCTMVGESTFSTDLEFAGGTFASASWGGNGWVLNTVAAPAGTAAAVWSGISCLTGGFCITSGGVATGSAPPYTVAPSNAQAPIGRTGYRMAASDGGVLSYGPAAPNPGAPFLGSMGGTHLNAPIVGMATTPSGDGYYLVASDGGVFNFGSAAFEGSAGGTQLNAPIVGMAVTADGGGYWLVASDGGIFSYGDAQFYGSTGGMHLNKPIVGMAATPNGRGYYLVASDGGVFTFGNAVFSGSPASTALNFPIVGMTVTPAGGYYLAAADGGVFAYGGAPFLGSAGTVKLNKPVDGIGSTPGGYYLVATDGGIFTYGQSPTMPLFFGSAAGTHQNAPIVGIGT